MVDDGELSVGLLDLELSGIRLHAQGVIVSKVGDHVYVCVCKPELSDIDVLFV